MLHRPPKSDGFSHAHAQANADLRFIGAPELRVSALAEGGCQVRIPAVPYKRRKMVLGDLLADARFQGKFWEDK